MAWKTKECGACFEGIDARATICPKCRTAQEFRRGAVAKPRSRFGRLLRISMAGFLGLMFVILAAGILGTESDGSRPTNKRTPPPPSSPKQQAARQAQFEKRVAERRQDAERRASEKAQKERTAAAADQKERAAAAAAALKERCEQSGVSAYVMTQDAVRSQLVSPSTADFPTRGWGDGRSIVTRPVGSCVYEVHAFVDSQNGFGAMLRARYTAKVKALEGGSWRVESVDFY